MNELIIEYTKLILNYLNFKQPIGYTNALELRMPNYPISVFAKKIKVKTVPISSITYFENFCYKLIDDYKHLLNEHIYLLSKKESKILLKSIDDIINKYHFLTIDWKTIGVYYEKASDRREVMRELLLETINCYKIIVFPAKVSKITKKFIWNREAKLFFILFTALRNAKYFSSNDKNLGINLSEIFKIPGSKTKVLDPDIFIQYFKKSGAYLSKDTLKIDELKSHFEALK